MSVPLLDMEMKVDLKEYIQYILPFLYEPINASGNDEGGTSSSLT